MIPFIPIPENAEYSTVIESISVVEMRQVGGREEWEERMIQGLQKL